MWHRLGQWASWLGVLETLAGCSSQPLTNDPPVTLALACQELGEASCAAFQSCSAEHFGSRYADQPNCVSDRALDCVERRSAPGNTVTAEQVAECAHATRGFTCQDALNSEFGIAPRRDSACTWQGTLLDGAACITSSQCASGTCAFYDRDACGTCLTRADLPCKQSNECELGAVCLNGQCLVAGLLGEPCGSMQPCSGELTCRSGQCAARGQSGEACGRGMGACAPDLWCNTNTLLCEHSTLLVDSTGCGVANDGSNFLCPSASFCVPDAGPGGTRCVPAGGAGDSCSYSVECGIGLGCYEGRCGKLGANSCLAADTVPNEAYPARLPSVPQGIAPSPARVLGTPQAVLISFASDAGAVTLEGYLQALGSSQYWRSTTAEYGVGALSTLPPIHVAEMPKTELPDAELRAWLLDKIANDPRFLATDSQTVYVLRYPEGVTVTIPESQTTNRRSCRDFGGYHSSIPTAAGTSIPYAVIPHCNFSDAETALAHELVEAATDPFSDFDLSGSSVGSGYDALDSSHLAWTLPASGGAELADLCEWQPLVAYRDPEIGGMVQRSWSNAAMAAFHQPCVPALSGSPYFNGVPHGDDQVTVKLLGRTVRTRGIALALGQSRVVPVDLLSDAATDGPWRVSAYDLKEWTNQFDYTAGTEPTLSFAFDRQSGVNGDTLQMTITALKQDPDFQAEPFVVVSRRGRETNVWLSVVAQP